MNAELLYNYVGIYAVSPEDYVETLKSMSVVSDPLKGRLFRGVDDHPALNLPLAMRVAAPAFKRLPGAVVLLTLQEAAYIEEKEHKPGFADRELRRWAALSIAGTTAARYLHYYLEVVEDYDAWITGHMKRFRMKRGRDFFLVECGGGRGRQDASTMPREEWVVTSVMAAEIVKVERTAKATQIISLWKGGM